MDLVSARLRAGSSANAAYPLQSVLRLSLMTILISDGHSYA
jgi:hypothetical protein